MTRDEIVVDLYHRLSSRKFWLCVVTILLAGVGYAGGKLDYDTFMWTTLGAFSVYGVAEGAVDVVSEVKKPRGRGQRRAARDEEIVAAAADEVERRLRRSYGR